MTIEGLSSLKKEKTKGEKIKEFLASGFGLALAGVALGGAGFLGVEAGGLFDTAKDVNGDGEITKDELGGRPFGFTTLDEHLWDREELGLGGSEGFVENFTEWWNSDMDDLVAQKVSDTPDLLTPEQEAAFTARVETFSADLINLRGSEGITQEDIAGTVAADIKNVIDNPGKDFDGDDIDNIDDDNPFINETEYSALVESQSGDALLVTDNNTEEGVKEVMDTAILNPFGDADKDGVVNVADDKMFVHSKYIDEDGNLVNSDKDALPDVWEDEIGTRSSGIFPSNSSFKLKLKDYTEITGEAEVSDEVKVNLDQRYGEYLIKYIQENPGATKTSINSAKVEDGFIEIMKKEYSGTLDE